MPNRKPNKKQQRPQAKNEHEKNQKAKMMIAFQIALIVGTILAIVGGFLISYGNHKIVSVWITFAGVVLIALSGALYLHAEALPEAPAPDANSSKIPVPASRPAVSFMPNQPINISSINQSGGITAHTVSISQQPPRRSISSSQLDRIKKALASTPRGDVTMVVVESDIEAVKFADEIESVLKDCGFNVTMNRVMMMSGPRGYPMGLLFEIRDPNKVPPHAQAIGNAFASCGIPVVGSAGSNADPDGLCITVGGRPQ